MLRENRSIAAVEGAGGNREVPPKGVRDRPGRGELSRKKGARGGNMVSPTRRSARLSGRAGGGDGALARARGGGAVRARGVEIEVVDDPEAAARRVAEMLAEAARAAEEIALTGGSTPRRCASSRFVSDPSSL